MFAHSANRNPASHLRRASSENPVGRSNAPGRRARPVIRAAFWLESQLESPAALLEVLTGHNMTSRVRKLFGTDGIRGVANTYPMTCETAMALGRALTQVIRKSGGRKRPRIVIGKDTRLSGYMFETAITSGICSVGGEAMLVGPLPTPGISFITSSMRADAGVVISASHNPYRDNGIKLFGADGFKLPDEVEAQIEAVMTDSAGSRLGAASAGRSGLTTPWADTSSSSSTRSRGT